MAAVLLAACASTGETAQSPADQVVGNWTCKTVSEGVTVDGAVNYMAGGTGKADVGIVADQGGMAVNIKATAESEWSFLEDGRMRESITKATVTSGSMNGQTVPAAMIQPMIEDMVVDQATTSTVEFAGNAMKLTSDDGTVTDCTR